MGPARFCIICGGEALEGRIVCNVHGRTNGKPAGECSNPEHGNHELLKKFGSILNEDVKAGNPRDPIASALVQWGLIEEDYKAAQFYGRLGSSQLPFITQNVNEVVPIAIAFGILIGKVLSEHTATLSTKEEA